MKDAKGHGSNPGKHVAGITALPHGFQAAARAFSDKTAVMSANRAKDTYPGAGPAPKHWSAADQKSYNRKNGHS